MMRIDVDSEFKRDYKRESKGKYKDSIGFLVAKVVEKLTSGSPLDEKYRDHKWAGDWKSHRDCHLKPDLILVYKIVDNEALKLVRIGSHSELGI